MRIEDFQFFIKGDFSDSLLRALYYVESQPSYNLLGRNCAWLALSVLAASFEDDLGMYVLLNVLLWADSDGNKNIIWPNAFNDMIEFIFYGHNLRQEC